MLLFFLFSWFQRVKSCCSNHLQPHHDQIRSFPWMVSSLNDYSIMNRGCLVQFFMLRLKAVGASFLHTIQYSGCSCLSRLVGSLVSCRIIRWYISCWILSSRLSFRDINRNWTFFPYHSKCFRFCCCNGIIVCNIIWRLFSSLGFFNDWFFFVLVYYLFFFCFYIKKGGDKVFNKREALSLNVVLPFLVT